MYYEKEQKDIEFEPIPDFAMKPAQELIASGADGDSELKDGDSAYNEGLLAFEELERDPYDISPYDELAAKEHEEAETVLNTVKTEKETEAEKETKMEKASETEQETEMEKAVFAVKIKEPIEVSGLQSKMIPMSQNAISSKLKVTDIKDVGKARIYIEEDVLVPDIKPDLYEILSMDGKIKLAEREMKVGQNGAESIKVSGDLIVQTLYIPEASAEADMIVAIESRIPFKSDYNVAAAPNSQLIMQPLIESVEFSRINERKVKVKATVLLCAKEYQNLQISIFEGIRDIDVQMLKEKIQVTDVALKKTEELEVKEELVLKEAQPGIAKILKYDISLVENHKQILKEKAVINGSIYCNVLYLGVISEEHTSPAPTLYQGKVDFTHFIKLNFENGSENPAGGKTGFALKNCSLTVKECENGTANTFLLEADIDTTIEVYKNVEKEVVTDIYHSQKEISYDTEELCLRTLSGEGAAEVAIREIINIPEKYGSLDKIAFISAELKEASSGIEEGRNVVEGIMKTKLIGIPTSEGKSAFSLEQEIPFRSSIDIPGIKAEMLTENNLTLKSLWFDKIGDKQVEVNGSISVNTTTSNEKKYKIVKSVSMIEGEENRSGIPALVLYITKPGDNIWKIAKKFRTTIDGIKEQNELDYSAKLNPGTKLLIEAKPN